MSYSYTRGNMSDENKTQSDPVEVPDTWYWIRGSDGKGSVTTTFVTVAFWVTTLAYVASMFESAWGIQFRAFDVGACAAYFIPLLTLYFGRRWTEANAPKDG